VLAADGSLQRARALAKDAERQAERARALADRSLLSPAERDTAQANAEALAAGVAAAEGTLAQARAALHQAEVNLGLTQIVSPIDGTIISRAVDVGQTVAASLQAPTLFTIAQDLAKMQVDTNVSEADVGKLQAGMRATFTVDAYPGERFVGTVRQIRNAPQTVQNVVTYDAVIDVANPELKLKPGMTATVSFVYAEREGVLRVPNRALRFRPPPELARSMREASGRPDAGAFEGQRRPHLTEEGRSSDGGRGSEDRRSAPAIAQPSDGGTAGLQPSDGGAPGARQTDAHDRGRRSGPGGDERPANERTVWRLGSDGTPAPVRIKVGVSDGTATELVEGSLAEGDRLVTEVQTSGGGPGGGGRPPGMGMGMGAPPGRGH
jgi:HlyD family secretion protein